MCVEIPHMVLYRLSVKKIRSPRHGTCPKLNPQKSNCRSLCLSFNQLCIYSNKASQLRAQELNSDLALGEATGTRFAVKSNAVA